MNHYKVAVMETLRKVVSVEAANEREARRRVADAWKNGEVILTCEDFTGAEFCVVGEDDGEKGVPRVDPKNDGDDHA